MLIDVEQIEPDRLKRLTRWGLFSGVIAECAETGAQLRVGEGRRRRGRKRRYFIWAPLRTCADGTLAQTQIGTTTAHYDEDAIEQANKRLSRLIDKRRKELDDEQTASAS